MVLVERRFDVLLVEERLMVLVERRLVLGVDVRLRVEVKNRFEEVDVGLGEGVEDDRRRVNTIFTIVGERNRDFLGGVDELLVENGPV
jgi:hypothetical protein